MAEGEAQEEIRPSAAEQQLMGPAAVIFYGVVAGLITYGIIESGEYVIREVRDRQGRITSERPPRIYDPSSKMIWVLQANGRYRPTGQRMD